MQNKAGQLYLELLSPPSVDLFRYGLERSQRRRVLSLCLGYRRLQLVHALLLSRQTALTDRLLFKVRPRLKDVSFQFLFQEQNLKVKIVHYKRVHKARMKWNQGALLQASHFTFERTLANQSHRCYTVNSKLSRIITNQTVLFETKSRISVKTTIIN